MMTAREVLKAIMAAEIAIRREGTRIFLTPRERVTPEIAEAVTEHRAALLWLLMRRRDGYPLHQVWVTPEVRQQWHFMIGAHRAV